jgi:hypothetical protein
MCAVILATVLAILNPGAHADQRNPAGVGYGVGAGVGRHGVHRLRHASTPAGSSGLLVADSAATLLLVASLSRYMRKSPADWRVAELPATAAGVAGGATNLVFLLGFRPHKQLAIMVVLTALTLTLRGTSPFFLSEWRSRFQTTELAFAVVTIALTRTR